MQVVCVGAFSLNLKLKIIPSLLVINIVPKPTGLRVFYKKKYKVLYARAPNGEKINQCHFETFWLWNLERYETFETFDTSRLKMAPLTICIEFISWIGPLVLERKFFRLGIDLRKKNRNTYLGYKLQSTIFGSSKVSIIY